MDVSCASDSVWIWLVWQSSERTSTFISDNSVDGFLKSHLVLTTHPRTHLYRVLSESQIV